ncbi:PREDICTED: lipase 3-like [Vollenhovia emeryi]|uniref:lipase 3-like n=1 Tax=Vollenhovia emeryi TaxID=411798 RepID=UPI0005F48C66|nr:PREDICTED: lipase 3-like [Vollenhovia emeryi]
MEYNDIFHEIGTKDLPAMFNYILNHTKQKDLYYIGHSMGGTLLHVLLSSKPEYNMKIKMAICLAPGVLWTRISPFVNEFINIFSTLKEVLQKHEIYDILPQSLATVTTARLLCNDNAITQSICITALFLIGGSDPVQLNTTTLPDIISYLISGASVQTVGHFCQNIRINEFRMYDYGVAENYKRYKQKIPPNYDLNNITAPIILFYSENDMLVPKENLLELSKRLPNVLLTEKVPYELFNHFDYTFGVDVKTLLYYRMLELIQNYNTNQNKSMK